MDCNRFFFQQEEAFSIEEMVDNLGAEAEEGDDASDFSDSYQQYSYSVSGKDLERINAAYMRMMSEDGADGADSADGKGGEVSQRRVSFADSVAVKFFDL